MVILRLGSKGALMWFAALRRVSSPSSISPRRRLFGPGSTALAIRPGMARRWVPDRHLVVRANQGDPDACLELALACPQDESLQAQRWFTQAAVLFRVLGELGEVRALHSLGIMYSEGLGPHWSQRDAVECFRRAADRGYAPSQYELARAHARGLGVPLDHQRAEELLMEAAEQGLEVAREALRTWWSAR